ncbi:MULTISPECIES: SpoIIE family protein phosphatase [unclassified Fibrobacter]|uniref:SpoIIE family protein phosphatase n=1 Tax=unclassified Fibrobacter TaxID=2634177 RepID=UPI00091E1962|nr:MULTISPECIES: SpoIIE family protein phosphatase [unclassified Fibrobacter]SHM83509.1 energy-coupling factor transport system substrate-specific component [Fibrobacter sp. UWB7]SMG38288.1 energy-coupling factor transport system substrate-specific component [Fibrobacter sp. UWB13]
MKNIHKYILIAIICGLIFFVLGFPCRELFKISDTTEVRIVAALPLLFGISFGFAGVLGCAIANLIADIMSGYDAIIFIPGFFVQIIYGYVPAVIWNRLRKNDKNKFKLDKVYKNVQYMLIVILDSLAAAFMVVSVIKLKFDEHYFSMLSANIFFNQFITMVIIGFPYLICASLICQNNIRRKQKKNAKFIFSFSLNEKFILFFLVTSIVISVAIGITSYPSIALKYGENNLNLWNYVYFYIGAILNIAIWVSLGFLYYMERTVTKPIESMSEIAKTFGQNKDIYERIHKTLKKCQKYVYFTSEVGKLARSYQEMATELDDYVKHLTEATAKQQKVHTELSIATTIQRASLSKPVNVEGFDNYAMMRPALEVGGDFYDNLMIDDDHLALVIADVSGKGVPAALFMMVSKIVLRHNLQHGLSPAEALNRANDELAEHNVHDMFVTCLCGVLNIKTGHLVYANAGHEKPFIKHENGEFEVATLKSGFVLAGMEGYRYKEFEVQLKPGDTIFTYTDGVPEATNEKDEEFGMERLQKILNESKDDSIRLLCRKVRMAVKEFAGNAPQFDDITMLAFKMK